MIDLKKTQHILFFVVILAGLSLGIAYEFSILFPNLPFWVETLSPLATYGILYAIFDNFLWNWWIFGWIFRKTGVVSVPDLNGRWTGIHRSSHKDARGNSVTIDARLEIKQSFSKIIVRGFYEKSESESVTANFTELNGQVYLFYSYDNDPNSLQEGTMQRHRGTSKLKYIKHGKKLIGMYFNSIKNTGDIELTFTSKTLVNHF